MDISDIGLLPPGWDLFADDESRLTSQQPQFDPSFGFSPSIWDTLPATTKQQIFNQHEYIKSITSPLLLELQSVKPINSSTTDHYSAVQAERIHLLSKSLLKIIVEQKYIIRHAACLRLIQAYFDFIVIHLQPQFLCHPKALRSAVSTLIKLLSYEHDYIMSTTTIRSIIESQELATKLKLEDYSWLHNHDPLSICLDWKSLYNLIVELLNLEQEDSIGTAYQAEYAVEAADLFQLCKLCSWHFDPSASLDLFSTIFPLLSTQNLKSSSELKANCQDSTVKSHTQDSLTHYKTTNRIFLDAFLFSNFLPIHMDQSASDSNNCIDYQALLDQIFDVWTLVPDNLHWDFCIISILRDLAKYKVLSWKVSYAQILITSALRISKLAIAGTNFASPASNSSHPRLARILPSHMESKIFKMIGSILVNIFKINPTDQDNLGLDVFLRWIKQITPFLHPNNHGRWTNSLINILVGAQKELERRLRIRILIDDLIHQSTDSKQSLATFTLLNPHQIHDTISNGNLNHTLFDEKIWNHLSIELDAIRTLLSAVSDNRKISFDITALIAHVKPDLIDSSIFPRIFYTINNPMLGGGTQISAAIDLMANLMPLLFEVPGSPTHLMNVLELLLDHVDPNDLSKSNITFKFAAALLTSLYLGRIGAASSKQRPYSSFWNFSPELLESLDSEIISLKSYVKDWIISLFERILGMWLKNLPAGSSTNYLQLLCQVAFSSIDEDIFDIILRKITHEIRHSDLSQDKEYFPVIIAACGLNWPDKTLSCALSQWIIAPSHSRATSQSSKIKSESMTVSDLDIQVWRLAMIGTVCRNAGDSLAKHEKALLLIIESSLADSRKEIRKAARKLIRSVLKGLSRSYIIGFRPHVNQLEGSDLMSPNWFVPTQKTLEMASRWINQFINPSISNLMQYFKAISTQLEPAKAAKEELTNSLQMLSTFIRGLATILPNMYDTENAFSEDEADLQKLAIEHLQSIEADLANLKISHKSTILPVSLPVNSSNTHPSQIPTNLQHLRSKIMRLSHHFVKRGVLSGKVEDKELVEDCFSLLISCLSYYGPTDSKASNLSKYISGHGHLRSGTIGTRLKSIFRSKNNPNNFSFWLERVQRATILAESKIRLYHWKITFGSFEALVVDDFLKFGNLHPELMTSVPLIEIVSLIPRMPGSSVFMISRIMELLSNPQDDCNFHSLRRNLGILHYGAVTSKLAANWKNINMFVQTLRTMHIHDHAMAQMAISSVYAMLLKRIHSLPASDTDPFFSDYVVIMNTLYHDLITPRPNTHWRYHLYTLGFICVFLRKSQQTRTWNENNGLNPKLLISALIPVLKDPLPTARQLARHAIKKLLAWEPASVLFDGPTLSGLLSPESLSTILEGIAHERSTKPAHRSIEEALNKITHSTLAIGMSNVSRWKLGKDLVDGSASFKSRNADFWFQVTNSAAECTDKEQIVSVVINFAVSEFVRLDSDRTSIKDANFAENETTYQELLYFALVEFLAGITTSFPQLAQNHIWPRVLSSTRIAKSKLGAVSFAIKYCVQHLGREKLESIETQLVSAIKSVISDPSASVEFDSVSPFEFEAKALLLLSFYEQAGFSSTFRLASLLDALFLLGKVYSSPHPQIRHSSADLLALLSALISNLPDNRSSTMDFALPIESHSKIISALLKPCSTPEPANVDLIVSIASVPTTASDRTKDTFLRWISTCLDSRIEIMSQSDLATFVLVAVINLSVEPSPYLVQTSLPVITKLSQLYLLPVGCSARLLSKQVKNLVELARHPRWKARASVLSFLKIFGFNHSALLSNAERLEILDCSKDLIADQNVEVCKKYAAPTFGSLLIAFVPDTDTIETYSRHFTSLATRKNKNARSKPREEKTDVPTHSAETSSSLLVGTVGLSAIASAAPYSVPEWLTKVIVTLQRLSSHSMGAVAAVATESIAQFWKTHRDEWDFYQASFTADQLQSLQDKPIPSYYA